MNKCCAWYIGNDDKYLFYYKTMYTLPQHVNEPKKKRENMLRNKEFPQRWNLLYRYFSWWHWFYCESKRFSSWYCQKLNENKKKIEEKREESLGIIHWSEILILVEIISIMACIKRRYVYFTHLFSHIETQQLFKISVC